MQFLLCWSAACCHRDAPDTMPAGRPAVACIEPGAPQSHLRFRIYVCGTTSAESNMVVEYNAWPET
jgi:hypothetical protein